MHICCSVDSHYFMTELRKLYPEEKITGFFYNPNIHPLSEHELRYVDVKRSCDKLGIELIKGEYDYEAWFLQAKEYANEPEKGLRCDVCFDVRMQRSVELAKKLKKKFFTSTLLMSPKKDLEQLTRSIKKECEDSNINFLTPDFRKGGGTQKQFELSKKEKLYHQNYCGCFFALNKQNLNKIATNEFSSPLNKQILPASVEERIQTYEEVARLEKEGKNYDIFKEKFLNYRLLSALVSADKKPLKSHILFYSHFKNKLSKFSLENECEQIFISKDEILLLSFKSFNELCENKFKSFDEFLEKTLSIEEEIKIRAKLFDPYNLSPIIVLEQIPKAKIEIKAKSEIYFDTRDRLVRL